MIAHPTLWTSPAPLWGRFGEAPGAAAFLEDDQERPAILRFASDDFMERLLALLEADPKQLDALIARPETWRAPLDEPTDPLPRAPLPRRARALARARVARLAGGAVEPSAATAEVEENSHKRDVPLKLYQPAHQRYYLVAANLVCGIAGFPDRTLATGGCEQVGFVFRRLLTTAGGIEAEYAFVKSGGDAYWQRVPEAGDPDDAAATLVAGEELLPLFPLTFRDDADRPRRLHGGLIPVGRREQYMGSARRDEPAQPASEVAGAVPSAAPAGPGKETLVTRRKEQLKLDVTEPWKNLVRAAHREAAASNAVGTGPLAPAEPPDLTSTARGANHSLQLQSWLLLLDFGDYLQTHLPTVWAAVVDPAKAADLAPLPAAKALYEWLNAPISQPHSAWPLGGPLAGTNSIGSLRLALTQVRGSREVLEKATGYYPDAPVAGEAGSTWPNFRLLLAGVRKSGASFSPGGVYESLSGADLSAADSLGTPDQDPVPSSSSTPAVETDAAILDKLVQLVIAALDKTETPAPAPAIPFAAQVRDGIAATLDDAGWFVLRCVHIRCDCGPLQPAVLSRQSQKFQLAGFFDPDAPARPVRIALPVDTTPAGMRKFNKNTAFLISDVLCGQIQRAKGLGFIDLVLSVLPWPLHKDLDVSGMSSCKNAGGNSIGMICSLSIPIITICALILLIIMVTLLDLIFRWLPWFILCFPLPRFLGKKAST